MVGGYFVEPRGDMRWTEEQLTAHLGAKPQKPINPKAKFKNIRCKSTDGKNFASRLERDYYEQLLLRHRAGDVMWYVRQPQFDLEGGVIYRADFLVVSRETMHPEIIDTKGFSTPEFKNKLRQVEARYGITVKLVRSV